MFLLPYIDRFWPVPVTEQLEEEKDCLGGAPNLHSRGLLLQAVRKYYSMEDKSMERNFVDPNLKGSEPLCRILIRNTSFTQSGSGWHKAIKLSHFSKAIILCRF